MVFVGELQSTSLFDTHKIDFILLIMLCMKYLDALYCRIDHIHVGG